MKKILLFPILTLLLFPVVASAQALTPAQVESILSQIQALEAQIQVIENSEMATSTVATSSGDAVFPTCYREDNYYDLTGRMPVGSTCTP